MKIKKKHGKKLIFALVALVLVAGIVAMDLVNNVSVAQAKQNTFTEIQPYQSNGLKILEITPTADDTEFGYFFKATDDGNKDQYVINYTYGTRFNKTLPDYDKFGTATAAATARVEQEARQQADDEWNRNHRNDDPNKDIWYPGYYSQKYGEIMRNNYNWYLQQAMQDAGLSSNYDATVDPYLAATLRSYGLIKPVGADAVIGSLSEYLIYDSGKKGIFGAVAGTNDFISVDIPSGILVEGHYEMSADNSGSYELKDGYCIGTGNENFDDAIDGSGNYITKLEANYIYKITKETVSGNSVGSVSGNTTSEVNKYEKIPYNGGIPEAFTYTGANGDVNFVYLANKSDIYYGYTVNKLVYLGNNRHYRVGNWVKEYVLGDAELGCNVTYTNKTIDNVTISDIQSADLIYISGTAAEFDNHAVSSEFVKEIYNQSAIYHKAVMMDYAAYNADNGLSNMDKLALLLWQDDQTLVSTWPNSSGYFVQKPAEPDDPADAVPEYLINDIDGLLGTNDVFTSLQGTMLSGYNGTFAVNNVYVYNHHWRDFQSSKLEQFQIDALDNFANGDFNSAYTPTVSSTGFQSVLAYIKLNNEKITTGRMSEGYVTPAIAIQYILSYRGEDLALAKNAYTVLEIEPTKEFKFNSTLETKDYTLESGEVKANRSEFISTCLNPDIVNTGNQELVTFDSMTIDQFNTTQMDLLTEYDVVYIGSLNEDYYEHAEAYGASISDNAIHYGTVAGITSFNNGVLAGNVYFNYGDRLSSGGSTAQNYSSRDLTEAKLLELKEFLQKDGLVIADHELMESTIPGDLRINPTSAEASSNKTEPYDHGRMDTSSNMYELFAYARGYTYDDGSKQYVAGADAAIYNNLVSEGDLKRGITKRESLSSYLNRERITLTLTSEPSDYMYTATTDGYITTAIYQTADKTDGKYYLDYEFYINNTTSVGNLTENYEVHFYQDLNADGRFGETEEKHDYEVTLLADGSQAANAKDEDGVTHYNLNGGVAYKLRREIKSDEGGYINWCIKIVKSTNADVYCQATGNTAIKPRTMKYINILQIIPDGNASTINLETLKESDPLYKYLFGATVTDQYEIAIRTVTVSQFQQDTLHYNVDTAGQFDTAEERWQSYFANFERTSSDKAGYTEEQIKADEDKPMNVNMLILGFGNSYTQFTNSAPVEAIENYIASNKPVLTSSNVVAENIYDTYKPKESNPAVMEIDVPKTLNARFLNPIGQDRYGYTYALYNTVNTGVFADRSEEQQHSVYILPREQNNSAIAYGQGNTRGTAHVIPLGYTNSHWARKRTDASAYGFIKTDPVKALTSANDPTAGATHVELDRMNEGQIVHYPYEIGDGTIISKTQAQYFQLDLDTDSDKDGNSDIVVWYTLGDMYAASSAGAQNRVSSADVYSSTPGDGINNYYIYNCGNVTFTGFGVNGADKITTGEYQLFVNTLIAAYEAGLINPTVEYYQTPDSNAEMLESIAVPYDQNVTGDNPVDSSVILNEDRDDYLYKFVNPNTQSSTAIDGTVAYFKVQDSNYVRGDKSCKVAFYMEVDGKPGDNYKWPDSSATSKILSIQLNDNTIVNVVRIPIDIYSTNVNGLGSKIGTSTGANTIINPTLEVGTMYGFYVPMSYLKNKGAVKIYIQANTSYKVISSSTGDWVDRPLGTAYDMFTIIKQDLLKLD